jgi:hypothetical protein
MMHADEMSRTKRKKKKNEELARNGEQRAEQNVK